MRSITLTLILALLAAFGYVAYRFWPLHASSQRSLIAEATFTCAEGKSVTAVFYESSTTPPLPGEPPTPGGSVDITLSDGRSISLPQTISADGARYANVDESFVFWNKGRGVTITETGQQTYTSCAQVAKDPGGLPAVYGSGSLGFTVRLPSLAPASLRHPTAYGLDTGYRYGGLGPGKEIGGIKFTIPGTMATGTNLSADTYISVELIPRASVCEASQFLDATAVRMEDGGMTWSIASSSGAAVGNRYEERVYAVPETQPCIAVRYFVHSAAYENFPEGSVRRFDQAALMAEFDSIRRTLVVVQ